MFGENLTVEGLGEKEVRIGDQYRVGSALLRVTQPRIPCFKLALKFERPDIVKPFHASGRTGFYIAVLEEGEVEAGDEVELAAREENSATVAEVTRLYASRKNPDLDLLERVVHVKGLSSEWREYFYERLRMIRDAVGHANKG